MNAPQRKAGTVIQYLMFIYSFYTVIIILSHLLVLKVVGIGVFTCSAAAFILPLSYTLCDIVAEAYGYKDAKRLILISTICQLLYGVLLYALLFLPARHMGENHDAYLETLKLQLFITLHFTLISYVSSYINAYTITKWKIMLKGRYFALRSIGASVVGESLFTFVTVLDHSLFLHTFSLNYFTNLFFSVMGLKIVYAIVIALPAAIVVRFLKQHKCVDQPALLS